MTDVAFLSVGVVSNAIGGLGFAALTVFLLLGWRGGRTHGALLMAACALNAGWCFTLVAGLLGGVTAQVLVLAEIARDGAWLGFIVSMLPKSANTRAGMFLRLPALLLPAALGGFFLLRMATQALPGFQADLFVFVGGAMALSLLAMILLEQSFRNAGSEQRWSLKYICLALGALFAYDFFMYSYSLLGQHIPQPLWNARGAVNALVVPLIAVAAARNPAWALDVHVSRRAVFHTGAMIGCGGYLLLMAVGGYFVRNLGGTWGDFLWVLFCAASALLLLVMLLSGELRARGKVFISKNFFSHKYDYREEWLSLTRRLNETAEAADPYERAIKAVAHIMESPGGALWLLRDGAYVCVANWNMAQSEETVGPAEPLAAFLREGHGIVDLRQVEHNPAAYGALRLPEWLLGIPRLRLVIPLLHEPGLLGFVLLATPRAQYQLTWEDRDLLQTIGWQIGSFLSQQESNQALAQARQFETFNRLTAFLMHDLKNIMAQQSLIVQNARKHKSNPQFVDDMILTVESSVKRMGELLRQLQRPAAVPENRRRTQVHRILQDVIRNLRHGRPVPRLDPGGEDAFVTVDPQRFATILGHVVRNAQEAAGADGTVAVRVAVDALKVQIRIEDDGFGMDQAFVRESLFRPFYTTKSSRGMGIGAFQAREFIRAAGGVVEVTSQPGRGTVFKIVLPRASEAAARVAAPPREAHA